jgi:uncharacterized protein (TIGR02145 family)
MDRNLGASRVATSSTDADGYGDLYQWGRRADGHQCRNSANIITLSSSDQPAHGSFIVTQNSPYDWRSPGNDQLWQGVNGVNNPCPSGYRIPTDPEFNAERLSWISRNSTGAFTSPLKLPMAGGRDGSINGSLYDVGTFGYYWNSTVFNNAASSLGFSSSAAYINPIYRVLGISVRCIKEVAPVQGSINLLSCNTSTPTGTLTQGQSATGVSNSVPYSGGNGGNHAGQTVASTGVAGLTATLASGSFANGAGALAYTISGTPASSGFASFALNIGGQNCTLTRLVNAGGPAYPAGTVHCTPTPTAVIEVINPTTGRTWMDRNLGASRVAISSTDAEAYGDLYQWGRRADGHQCRNSGTTSVLSSTDQPAHGKFILEPGLTYDWQNPRNDNLWQGVNGVNNPCPIGYRLPTVTELDAERVSWSSQNSAGAFATPLKLPVAGYRSLSDGSLNDSGSNGPGLYWCSTAGGTLINNLFFDGGDSRMSGGYRAHGFSVRCLKEAALVPGSITMLNCIASTPTGTLTQGVEASGVSSTVPYSGGNGGAHTGQTVASTGVNGLTATLSAGSFANGAGTLVYTITGTPANSGTASFVLNIGGQACTLTRITNAPAGIIATLNCAGDTPTRTLTQGVGATGVSSSIPYTGGNGGMHTGQTVPSTGVTGLTATLASSSFANGAGTLVYTIRGTPASSGIANFALNIGGQNCTLTRLVNAAGPAYPAGTVHCTPTPTAVVEVLNPTTGKTWMDRNLGATRAATSSTDADAYGDLYLWGRRADGHQCRNSATTATVSSTAQPAHGNFITTPNSPPWDWLIPQNNNLWQGQNGINNPCPIGYKIPTEAELNAERTRWVSQNNTGAFASPLKFTISGARFNDGSLQWAGTYGYYWTSTLTEFNNPILLYFGPGGAIMNNLTRNSGYSVRCLKN